MYALKEEKGHIKDDFDLDVQGQLSRSGNWFYFRESWNRHRDLVCTIYTTRDMEGHNSIYL